MEYTPGVSIIYAFLEAVTLDRPADVKKKISVQRLCSELGLNNILGIYFHKNFIYIFIGYSLLKDFPCGSVI